MAPNIEGNDDAPVGRVLSRREVMTLFAGLGGVALLAVCGPLQSNTTQPTSTSTAGTATGSDTAMPATDTPLGAEAQTAVVAASGAASPTADTGAGSCVVRPEETEGPYFIDEKINRSDIRSDTSTGTVKQGVPLALAFMVSQVASNVCTPLKGAQVDIWHCDAAGTYSDENDPGFNTVGQNYLRGYQVTDGNGKVAFTTNYPGWYSGRTVHIHFKIRTTGTDGKAYEFTSQLFFDDSLSDKVFTQSPYASKGTRNTRNATDSIYTNGGDQLLLAPTEANGGYSATFNVSLDLSNASVGASDSARNASPGGPGMGPNGTPGQGGPPNGAPPAGATPTP